MNIVALTADKRSPEIPAIPTAAEQGLPGLQIGSWNALLGPAGLPAAKVDVLNKALASALEKPAVRKRLAEMGIDVLPLGTAAYASHLKAESDKWTKVVSAAGTKLD
ncbi:Tripartite tricarboxylate transporter family receptor [compost metagenome]